MPKSLGAEYTPPVAQKICISKWKQGGVDFEMKIVSKKCEVLFCKNEIWTQVGSKTKFFFIL
jgi:hypothetical protein